MRLRRETGDFQIVVKSGEEAGTYVANSIRPGLSAEDLIGEVANVDGELELLTHGYNSDDEVIITSAYHEFDYTPSTGEIAVSVTGD